MTLRIAVLLLVISPGLTACSDAAVAQLDAARAACRVTIQTFFPPISDKRPVTFEQVANVAVDRGKFEFVWKQSQIKNLLPRLALQEIATADRGQYRVILESGDGGEREYVCRGSLSARALQGVWVRHQPASRPPREVRLTSYTIDF